MKFIESKGKKFIALILAVFLGGLLSGFIFQLFIFPSILANSYFSQFQFIKNFKEGKIIINTREEYLIGEETALEKAVERVEQSVVGIQSKTSAGTVSGSGLIVTFDGMILTLADVAPKGAVVTVFFEGEEIKATITKRDAKNNLALLKIERNNLKTCGFADPFKMKLGQRVFLVGIIPSTLEEIANDGLIRSFNESTIKTNISEVGSMRGSPLFNIWGDVVGVNTIGSDGKVSTIPAEVIHTFVGF
ncbi:MAG: serine protease [Candidatus Staskawiczbacteria bacterium]|jgi:S1-C subfamily serine protease